MDMWDKVEYWEIDGTDIIFYDKNDKEVTRANIDDVIDVYIEQMIDIEKKEKSKQKLKEVV